VIIFVNVDMLNGYFSVANRRGLNDIIYVATQTMN